MLTFSGCSLLGVSHRTHEPDKPSEYPGSVGEIAWTWKPPRGADRAVLHEMGEGVLVLLDTGVFALSGKTGEELWSYHDRNQTLISNVSANEEYVVLHDEDTSKMTLLERDTGQVAHEYTLDLSEVDHTYRVRADHVYEPLSGITGETWFVRTKEAVASYDLATGDKVWETSDVPNCVDEGWVDSLSMQDDVVVAATTCYEQPEDREDDVAWIAGWDFISELAGFAPESGEELWRIEHSVGNTPAESLQRDIVSRPGGLVKIDYLDSPSLGYSLLDIEAQEVTHLETQRPLWFSPDGDRLGLWDTETGQYRVQDRSGQVEQTLAPELVSMGEGIVTDGYVVGLEEGVLHLEEWLEDASVPEGFARFEGFEGSSVLVWDNEESMRVHSVRSVPGAVAVLSTIDGDLEVLGLR